MSAARRGEDAGFTLVEILVTLVILGVAVSAILAGLGIASRGSGDTRAAADASALLTATAEQIERAAYEPCPIITASAYPSARASAAPPIGAGPSSGPAVISNLTVWNGQRFEAPTTAASPTPAPCAVEILPTAGPSPSLGAMNKMQRITVRHGDDSLTFVKRGP